MWWYDNHPSQGNSGTKSLRQEGAYQIPGTDWRWMWLGYEEQGVIQWKVRGGKSESRSWNSAENCPLPC